jgi:hypothetical protein
MDKKSNGTNFDLGSLTFNSKSDNSVSPASSSTWFPNFDNEACHHIDWALCTVIPSRQGSNRHRYLCDLGSRSMEFFGDKSDTRGLGNCVQETCRVEAFAEVYYVGQRTGR